MIINDENLEILRTHHEAAFEEGKASGPPTAWEQVATEIPSRGSQNLYSWLGQFPQLREWVGDRFINDLKAYDYTIQNRTFEGTIEVKKEEIEDNQAFERTMLTRAMGEQARKHPDKLVFGLLKNGTTELGYDRQPFFDGDHPVPGGTYSNVDAGGDPANPYWYLLDTQWSLKPFIFQRRQDYNLEWDESQLFMRRALQLGVDARVNVGFGYWQMAYASNQDLTTASFDSAWAQMAGVPGTDGDPLTIRPRLLVVPNGLRAQANAVIKAREIAGTTNTNFEAVDILVSPYL